MRTRKKKSCFFQSPEWPVLICRYFLLSKRPSFFWPPRPKKLRLWIHMERRSVRTMWIQSLFFFFLGFFRDFDPGHAKKKKIDPGHAKKKKNSAKLHYRRHYWLRPLGSPCAKSTQHAAFFFVWGDLWRHDRDRLLTLNSAKSCPCCVHTRSEIRRGYRQSLGLQQRPRLEKKISVGVETYKFFQNWLRVPEPRSGAIYDLSGGDKTLMGASQKWA